MIITPVKKRTKLFKKSRREKLKPYNSSSINSRNFLPNISYNGVRKEDLYERNFVFDVYVLVTKNMNPFSLERKVLHPKYREKIYMFWDEYVNVEL